MKEKNEILSLTGLRFVAAFYVFVFHLHIRWPISSIPFVHNILSQGAIGMSLFFMLSGFVLAYRYTDRYSTLGEYFINRFARIYPIYVVAALLTLPWIGISFGSGSFADLSKGVAQLFLLIFANIFIIQAWFPQFFNYWNDGGSWSISVEVFCYILLPFFLPRLLQASMGRLFIIVITCWLLAVLPGISASLFDAPSNVVFYSMPIFRLPEFLIGTCVYLAIRLGLKFRIDAAVQLGFVAILIGYLALNGLQLPLYVGHNWIALPLMAFIIFSLSTNNSAISLIFSNRLIVWLGKISYSFYSFQAFLILLLISYHDKLVQLVPALENNTVLAIASLTVLVALSASGYYLIEEPARRMIRRFHVGASKLSI